MIGIYSDIDELTFKIDSIQEKYKFICEQLTKIIDPKAKNDLVKLEFSEKHNWFLHCTKNRSKTIINYLKMKNKISIKDNSVINYLFLQKIIYLLKRKIIVMLYLIIQILTFVMIL